MIFTVLQDVVDSVGVVDRCSGTPVDRFELVYVDQCSVAGVDRHQCDPPKLIKLSTSKSPSYSFSSSRTCQKSSSIITFTWCFITSSLTPLVEASCLLIASPVCTTCISIFFKCVQVGVHIIYLPIEVHCHSQLCLRNPIEHLFNLALLSRRRWLLVVGTSKIHVVVVAVVVGFLVLRILVEVTPIFIGVFVSTLVSLESSSTNVVYFFFLALPSTVRHQQN